MQGQKRLIRVWCVLCETCKCWEPHRSKTTPSISVLVTCDSKSHAIRMAREMEIDAPKDQCEKCGHVDRHWIDSAEYQRFHFVYND